MGCCCSIYAYNTKSKTEETRSQIEVGFKFEPALSGGITTEVGAELKVAPREGPAELERVLIALGFVRSVSSGPMGFVALDGVTTVDALDAVFPPPLLLPEPPVWSPGNSAPPVCAVVGLLAVGLTTVPPGPTVFDGPGTRPG